MALSIAIKQNKNNFNNEQDKSRLSMNNISQQTVTSVFAGGHPSIQSPGDAIKYLFPNRHYPRHHLRCKIRYKNHRHEVTAEELDIAEKYGRFSQRPSDLFLKLFYGVIRTLQCDPLAGRVSPALIGSSGVIPLTIISIIPDIMRHYYHVIVHAQKEILFATMFWEKSDSANIIRQAFRDLSKRAGDENRRVIIKLMIDRPNISNAIQFHSILPSSKWSYYDIPSPEEIPNISLEVHNYHHFIMGTFHAKFLIVDRKLVLLNSNNIQNRPNLEMMSQYEGEIVNSFYDTFLISWSLPFQPNLLCLNDNALVEEEGLHFDFDNSTIVSTDEAIFEVPLRFKHLEVEEIDIGFDQLALSSLRNENKKRYLSDIADRAVDYYRASHLPNLLVKKTNNPDNDVNPQWQPPLTEHLNKSLKSARFTRADKNISSEEMEALSLEFTPFIFHRPHKPFPIALVSRLAHGTPTHKNTRNPQDAAWMGAFRYAQKSIFIQTPTLNASPAVNGIIGACRRGIQVTLWLGWGFNDLKEGRGTFQGGTNEQVVKKLYKELKKTRDGLEQNLQVFWYTAKDQMRPIHFSQKERNCHIKFMSIDDQVAIMGNANMDSLSWFHSQETNAMIDSPIIVQDWINALHRNQSTHAYGKLNTDGIWCNDQTESNPKNPK